MKQKRQTPSQYEFILALEQSLAYCREADDLGSIDWEMARWQDWVNQWAPILDGDGGL